MKFNSTITLALKVPYTKRREEPRLFNKFKEVQEAFSKMTEKVRELISGIKIIQAFQQEDEERINFDILSKKYLEKNISIFPNPTSGFVQIKIREWVSDYQYEIYNVLGQTLKFNELQNNEILDLSDLPSDIYFMKITEIETNKILIKKIVLNK